MSTKISGKTYASVMGGSPVPSIANVAATKECLRGTLLDIGPVSNESDTSLGEGNNATKRSQRIDSSGNDTEDDYAQGRSQTRTTKVNDEISDTVSESSSTASQKRKRSPKRGSSSAVSKGPVIPENSLFVGDIPIQHTEKEIFDFFTKIGEIKSVRLMKKRNGMSKVCRNLHATSFSCHALKHHTSLI
jgi:hypothetical protein